MSCIGRAQLWHRGGLGADLLVYSMTRSPTNPSCHSDVVRKHYRRMAESLTFSNGGGQKRPGCGRQRWLLVTFAQDLVAQDLVSFYNVLITR
jgi:hypothetical protein